jgi:hypothetical protein
MIVFVVELNGNVIENSVLARFGKFGYMIVILACVLRESIEFQM